MFLIFYCKEKFLLSLKLSLFVPTSSALAIGSGLTHNPELYKAEPQSMASAFGKNYFVNNESQEHSSFLKEKQVKDWILSRLSTLIVGPINAYTNAQYFLDERYRGDKLEHR